MCAKEWLAPKSVLERALRYRVDTDRIPGASFKRRGRGEMQGFEQKVPREKVQAGLGISDLGHEAGMELWSTDMS